MHGIVPLEEVAEADAHQTKALLRPKADAFTQGKRDRGQLFAGRGRSGGRVTAGENLELSGLQFEYDGACDSGFLARGFPSLFRELADHRFHRGERNVLLEGIFG